MNHSNHPGTVSNQLFPDTYGKPIQQTVTATPNNPIKSTEAFGLSMANTPFTLVQPPDQSCNTALSHSNVNSGIGSSIENFATNNQLGFNQLISNSEITPILPIQSASFASAHPQCQMIHNMCLDENIIQKVRNNTNHDW